jgi:hypothetical protein
MNICRSCGCTELQVMEDIRTLSLPSGIYTCCQVVAWADEQWQAWLEAANEDGKQVDDVTRPLERVETEAVLVPVRIRRPLDLGFGRGLCQEDAKASCCTKRWRWAL